MMKWYLRNFVLTSLTLRVDGPLWLCQNRLVSWFLKYNLACLIELEEFARSLRRFRLGRCGIAGQEGRPDHRSIVSQGRGKNLRGLETRLESSAFRFLDNRI